MSGKHSTQLIRVGLGFLRSQAVLALRSITGCGFVAGTAVPGVISDREIWAAASVMVHRYKADAMLEGAARADSLLEDGEGQGGICDVLTLTPTAPPLYSAG